MKREIPDVRKIANAEDETQGDAFDVLEFRKVGNRRGELPLERDKARDPSTVFAALLRKNADLPLDETKGTTIVRKAIEAAPPRRILYCATCGWRPNRKAFVTPRGVIGAQPRRELFPPLWLNTHHRLPMNRTGTLEAWQKRVAEKAIFSNIATLSISMAFAAPLLEFVGLQPFGVNIHGRSKIGKTTAALAGSSVIGIGRESELPNWSATAASHTEHARIFNGMIMPVNELGLIAGSKKDAFPKIRNFIYAICEGRDRQRRVAPESGRLLCVLLLRRRAVPANTGIPRGRGRQKLPWGGGRCRVTRDRMR